MPPVDNAYKLRNQEFLQEYAQRPGVKIMFNGVMYREITKGNGPKPSPKSFVTVYYTGKLINGKVFDHVTEMNNRNLKENSQQVKGGALTT